MKISLFSLILAIFFISLIKTDEPNADHVRAAYNAYVAKFKKAGHPKGFALVNVDGFWQSAETTEVFIDAYERFQDVASKEQMIEVVESWLKSQGEDWKWNAYNDDIMWACIMLTRTYLHTKTEKYLTIAKNNFKTVWDRAWNDQYGGGLVWCEEKDKTSKNACVNGPGAIAACFLAIATGDNSYYEKADDMIKWLNKMLVQEDGGVWDCIDWDSANNKYTYNTWVSTYNQGTYIGACKMLYEHNHNSEYLEMAKNAAKRATKIAEILDGEDNGGDLIGFKGILARWLGKLIRDLNIDTYNKWTTNNAHSAWINRNNDNIMWTKFGTKTEDNIENSSQDNKRRQTAWGCSAPLSWLINLAAL